MSFLSAREHGAKPGSGGVASAQSEVRCAAEPPMHPLLVQQGAMRGVHRHVHNFVLEPNFSASCRCFATLVATDPDGAPCCCCCSGH